MWIEFSKLVVCFYFCSTVAYASPSRLSYTGNSGGYNAKNAVSDSSYNNYKVSKSRYPHLDRVKKRIENMNNDEGSSRDSYRVRHKGWINYNYRPTTTTTTTTTTENGLFETYGDFEDGDLDYLVDEDDDLDYDDDTEDPFFDSLADIQAEEPTERPTVAPKSVSSLTEYKWAHFGSAANVAESRRTHIRYNSNPQSRKVNAAVEHTIRVNQQGKCGTPSPKVISVQREHPDPTKTYTPHCTVLHRCGEDTGCCRYGTTCHYKHRVLVPLYFYTTTLGSSEAGVEILNFYNHTECECREKTDEASSEQAEEGSTALSFKSADSQNPSIDLDQCKCPKHFTATPVYHDNSCSCDCEEDNSDCIQLKKGNEHLSMTDRICISNNECTMPVCEYGTYSSKQGKCPSIADKLMEYRKIRINH